MDDHDVAEDEVEDDDVENDDVKGEEDDDVDVEEEEDDDVEEEDRSQDQEAHFVRACVVEMRNTCHKRYFIRKFTGKMPGPRTATHTLCEPAQSKRMSRFHKSHFIRKFTGKMPQARTATHTMCEPARSKRMSRFHKSHLGGALGGVQMNPRPEPLCTEIHMQVQCRRRELRPTLCASLRSRNACQDFTKSHFTRKFTSR